MEELTLCDICFHSYDGKERLPKLLTCGHTYCASCIKNAAWRNSTSMTSSTAHLSTCDLEPHTFECFECRRIITVTKIDDLAHNFTILSLLRLCQTPKQHENKIDSPPLPPPPPPPGTEQEKQEKNTCTVKQNQKQPKPKTKPVKPVKRKKPGPKRAKSAFNYYVQSKLRELRQTQPTQAFGELSTRIAEMWKNSTKEQRQPFVEQSQRDKDRFCREWEAMYPHK